MDRMAVIFEAERTGYSIDQVADRAMTVGELIQFLSDFNEDTLFILSHDNGYTYGSISFDDCKEAAENEDGEWEE
ncbi:MAG: hypothetical protein II897_04100 [Clostridia bacterium]|nr:hypothetical protein [Clostridia bacterium]